MIEVYKVHFNTRDPQELKLHFYHGWVTTYYSYFSTLQELDLDSLGAAGTTDRRLVQHEKDRLQKIYQKEIELFIDHLR